MSTPKPQPPKQAPAPAKAEKKDFVLNPHLHQKPFRDHEGLSALKSKLVQNKKETKR